MTKLVFQFFFILFWSSFPSFSTVFVMSSATKSTSELWVFVPEIKKKENKVQVHKQKFCDSCLRSFPRFSYMKQRTTFKQRTIQTNKRWNWLLFWVIFLFELLFFQLLLFLHWHLYTNNKLCRHFQQKGKVKS